jgi:hypothetical protein
MIANLQPEYMMVTENTGLGLQRLTVNAGASVIPEGSAETA